MPHPIRPLLLTLGMYWSWLQGSLSLLGFVVGVAGCARDSGGEQTGPTDFALGLGAVTLITGVLFLVIASGLSRHRPWTRPLMLFFWFASGASQLGSALGLDPRIVDSVPVGRQLVLSFVGCSWLFATSLAALYLYAKPSVKRHYREIGEREERARRLLARLEGSEDRGSGSR